MDPDLKIDGNIIRYEASRGSMFTRLAPITWTNVIEQRLIDAWRGLQQNDGDAAAGERRKRLRVCVSAPWTTFGTFRPTIKL